jgi:two-component system, NarL family, sensor histidine kinase DegS
MNKAVKLRYEKKYQDNLRIHLKRKLNGVSTSRAARSIGSQGLSLGLNVIDLARTHEQAIAVLDAPGDNGSTSSKMKIGSPLSAAGKFLLEALVPFEQSHQDDILKVRTSLFVAEERLDQEKKFHRALIDDSQEIHEQSRQLSYQFLLALEEERKEISRELHDQVAQILAGINVRLAALKSAAMIDHENLAERIAQTQVLVEQSVEAIHSYARKLRPVMLDDLGLIPSLRSFIKDLPDHEGLRIRFKHFADVENLDNLKRTIIFRVAQEAITNVLRHSNAKNATLRLKKLVDSVVLEVSDDGKSFSVERTLNSKITNRLGLLGMRERVEMVDGTFSIESSPGKGTMVRAVIPLDEKLEDEGLSK